MPGSREPLTDLTVRPLDARTWDAFAALAERHNGVWGGCWCTYFHPARTDEEKAAETPRERKQRLVLEGRTHHALVLHGDEAIGWCQYGSPEELPRITHRAEVESVQERPPDHRITCFFVDRRYRRQGISAVALRGALDQIAAAGGGVVETYPQDTQGRRITASFLHNGTRSLFEQAGFTWSRPKGKNHCVMWLDVPPAPGTAPGA